MKTLDWQRFLEEQETRHGKAMFSVTELANVARTTPGALNVELWRLIQRKVICRYAHGKYGRPGIVTPEEVLPFLDSAAYITGLGALHRHNRVTQVPAEITCFTNRRHNRSRRRATPLGRFVFVCVGPGIYAHPAHGKIAAPEQALCDFLYLSCRSSLAPESLVTFLHLEKFQSRKLKALLARYPSTVAEAVRRLTADS
jgi:hypothetical protein